MSPHMRVGGGGDQGGGERGERGGGTLHYSTTRTGELLVTSTGVGRAGPAAPRALGLLAVLTPLPPPPPLPNAKANAAGAAGAAGADLAPGFAGVSSAWRGEPLGFCGGGSSLKAPGNGLAETAGAVGTARLAAPAPPIVGRGGS